MKTLHDEFESLEPGEKVQVAYDESGHEPAFSDFTLQPWTCARHGIAIQMGSALIQALGPHVSAFLRSGNYPNVYRDSVIVLWLSSLERDEIRKLCALPDPEFRVIEAYEWFEKAGGKFGSKLFFDGVKIMDAVVRDILASTFSIEDTEGESGEDKKKVTGQPGKSNISSEPSRPVGTTPITSTSTCHFLEFYNGARCGLPRDGNHRPNWFSRLVSATSKRWLNSGE